MQRRSARLATAALPALAAAVVFGIGIAPAQAASRSKTRGGLEVEINGLPRGEHPGVVVEGVRIRFRRTFHRDGRFQLRNLLIGRYRIVARWRAFRRTTTAGALKGLKAIPIRDCAPVCKGPGVVQVVSYANGIQDRSLSVSYTSGRARGAARFKELSGGFSNGFCGLRTDGIERCWGGGGVAPPAGRLTHLFDGTDCGLRPDRTLVCGGAAIGSPPQGVPLSRLAETVVIGTQRESLVSCGLRADARIACWGGVAQVPGGQFVDLALVHAFNPTDFSERPVVCGLRADGSLTCAGASTALPPGSLESVHGVGDSGLAGITPNGSAIVAGADGNSAAWSTFLPGAFTQLSGTCGLRLDGAAVCSDPAGSGTPIVTPGPFTQIAASGDGSVCGLHADGTVACQPGLQNVPTN